MADMGRIYTGWELKKSAGESNPYQTHYCLWVTDSAYLSKVLWPKEGGFTPVTR